MINGVEAVKALALVEVDLPPTQDASHHQDGHYLFSFLVGDLNLNLHLPLESWVGGRSNQYQIPSDQIAFLAAYCNCFSNIKSNGYPENGCLFSHGVPERRLS